MYPVEPLYIDGLAPIKAHESDAAYDLRASETNQVGARGRILVSCGVAIEIPEGCVGLVCPRSGLAIERGITILNAPGIIDPGYRGDIKVILANFGHSTFHIYPGDRIAQLLILSTNNYRLVQSKNRLAMPTDRGIDGFGSTGVGAGEAA